VHFGSGLLAGAHCSKHWPHTALAGRERKAELAFGFSFRFFQLVPEVARATDARPILCSNVGPLLFPRGKQRSLGGPVWPVFGRFGSLVWL